MHTVDLVLSLVLVLCALRGYWRGFFRECCGLLALLGGLAAAMSGTEVATTILQRYGKLPPSVEAGVAFVAIFVVVNAVVTLVGVFLDRLAGALVPRINRIAGAVFGATKAAVVLAFVLLFAHLFPFAPQLDGQIMDSSIGRSLVTSAGDVLRLGVQAAGQPDTPSQT